MGSDKTRVFKRLNRHGRKAACARGPVLARLRRFASERAGNVAVTFALALAPLSSAVGGALDYTRAVMIGTEIQGALDSGVLAAASLTQDRDPETVVRAYVEAALGDHKDLVGSLVIDVTTKKAVNARTVSAEASVSMKTIMLGLIGIETMTVRRSSEALEEVRNIEISLVLDISSSMRGRRIDNLRAAALDFVDTMLDGDKKDMTSISVIPYGGTVRLDRSFYRFIESGKWFRPDGLDYKVEIPERDDWNGCIEFYGDEVADIALTPGGYGVIPEFTVWNRGNDWCPNSAGTEAVFLSNDRARLRGLISNFDNPVLSDGTGTDIATAWGVRALDPHWRGGLGPSADFSDRPAAYRDEETIKVMVVMTDGGITQQRRPEGKYREGKDDPHVGTKGTDDLYSKGKARGNFLHSCADAKSSGVQVYAIAFQVNGGRNRQDLKGCASSAHTYYQVEDLDISAAFAAIAADINQLRLSR